MFKKREAWVGPVQKFVVRMPEGLREQLSLKAKQRHRSLNGEIVRRVSAGLDQPDPVEDDSQPMLESADLKPADEKILTAFRLLDPEKQQALLSLIVEMALNSESPGAG